MERFHGGTMKKPGLKMDLWCKMGIGSFGNTTNGFRIDDRW